MFEPGDPARIPGARLAWLTALAAAIVIVIGFAFAWRSYYLPGGELPSILPDQAAAPPASPAPAVPAAAAPIPADGAVVFTSEQPGIWVKFYDGAGKQLMQKEMALGESWTVPAGVPDVKLWTARPEALAISIGGQPVAKLSDIQKMMKDVPVTAAALRARAPAGGAPAAPAASPAAGSPTPAAAGVAPRPAPAG